MQVSHVNEFVTHAVIGGGKAIDFGISNSAEFFNILSSTLYKDQILAVVREVMCNANDAHIEAGITDKPFEVTITGNKITIRDFGTGIHLDDMGTIYGTYGNSTKKNDGMQTGGFGLGCKAPFAYTDHFEVNSYHDGIRTIYNLSKSSAQAMGKPGITPIASFPTTETGLQVSIDIKNTNDLIRFKNLVKRIAHNGDMNVNLNGEKIVGIGFDGKKSNYFITTWADLLETRHRVMVRYGNVIYPVEADDKIKHRITQLVNHLDKLSRYSQHYSIIFQAPPHSISVTPSRESLSMQEHTTNTLNALIDDFFMQIKGPFQEECSKYAEAIIVQTVNEAKVPLLLHRDHKLPGHDQPKSATRISDLGTMAAQYMQTNYPSSIEFRKKDISFRLKTMVTAGLLNRGLVQTFLRQMEKVVTPESRWGNYKLEHGSWLQKEIIGPILAKMQAQGMDHKRLYVYDREDRNAPKNEYRQDRPPLVEATSAAPRHLFACLPYMRNIVVLATTRVNLMSRAEKHEVMKELGKFDGFLFYHISMRKNARDEALAFFKARGMEIIDLTVRQSWELPDVKASNSGAPRKPVKKGLVKLTTAVNVNKKLDTTCTRGDTAERIEEPEYIVDVPINRESRADRIWHLDTLASLYFIELHGDKGGVTNNIAVHKKWLGKGVKDFKDYYREMLIKEMTTNPRILEFWAFNPELLTEVKDHYGEHKEFIRAVYKSKELRALFGLVNNMTEDDKKYLYMWEQYNKYIRDAIHPDIKAVNTQLDAIPLDPINTTFTAKVKKNPLIKMIDESGVVAVLDKYLPGSKEAKNAISILTTVLNNP